ncbi:phosphotransferase family protein [Erythrobacter sp. W53]|uniref:phosphotransferase family protein n=1 Tax=Erythrobacter sp. W53 TaxID=3425947 RepID=UPI003D7677C8
MTPEWLSQLLGTPVGGVSWEPIGTGQVGDSVRFHLHDTGEGASATLAGKFPAEDQTSRGTAAMMGLYAKEVSFYREAAAKLAVRTPAIHFAKADPGGTEFAIIFEDLGPARGGNQIEGCSLNDACAAIKQAAALHASSWHNAGILGSSWLTPPEGLRAQLGAMYPQAQKVFAERYAGQLEPKYMALCAELAEVRELWTRTEDPPQCLVHGDFRLDNMLFDIKGGAEPIAILDWQTVTAGKAMTDIGYFLGCGIGDEMRRVHEEALLHDYLTEMDRRGVTLTRDDIWHDYRIGALHGVSTAVFSAANVERTERGDTNFLSMARGACALAMKHDSIGALREVI